MFPTNKSHYKAIKEYADKHECMWSHEWLAFQEGDHYVVGPFENGLGASIIRHKWSFGGNTGLYELAVLDKGDITYSTPITSDVRGNLEFKDVLRLLDDIQNVNMKSIAVAKEMFKDYMDGVVEDVLAGRTHEDWFMEQCKMAIDEYRQKVDANGENTKPNGHDMECICVECIMDREG